jgi:8-oxo-dGTP pyrophosphatase MutT (NUDIX family)
VRAEAAVLLPFFDHADGPRLLLTRRAEHLPRHAGQMSFPGGVRAPGDRDLLDTALRETAEETGILPAQVEPLGRLGHMLTVSGYRMHVYAAWLQPRFTLQPDPGEVAAVHMADAAEATGRARFRWRDRDTPAGRVRSPELALDGQRVWGITAIILWQLARLLEPTPGTGVGEMATVSAATTRGA